MQEKWQVQVERDFELKWRLSIRASGVIHKTAKRFGSSIEITHGDERADARSMMSMLALGEEKVVGEGFVASDTSSSRNGLKAGSHITITARGADAADALVAIVDVLSRSDLDYG